MSNKSYLEERIYEGLGLTLEQNRITVQVSDSEDINTHKVEIPIFESDQHDNILINYWDIFGNRLQYDHADPDPLHNYNNKRIDYQRKRLKEAKDGNKYLSPKGQGTFPFFPPSIIDKFAKGETINTLIITEGEFKAVKGCLCGLDVISIPGIQNLADKRVKRLYPDIGRLILKCGVKNIVMLYDGDCLNISKKHLEQCTELTQRPASFFNAMLNFFSYMDGFEVKTYFAHVLTSALKNNPKGLDDLFCEYPSERHEICEDILRLGKGEGQFFYRLNMNSFSTRLQSYFHLKLPDDFYSYHADIIRDKEFVFNGSKYKLNEKLQKLERTIPKDLMNYMRVGNEFYEIVQQPDEITGELKEVRHERTRSTIRDDFPNEKDVFQKIQKYKAFVTIPSHDNYKRVVHDCYNRYYPMRHEPAEGKWDTIKSLFLHIFGKEKYDFGMDYVNIMYKYPTHPLPILCLVSKDNETGKSTFFEFLTYIFGNNSAMIAPEDIEGQFNGVIFGKIFCYLEENNTGDNARLTERIKSLANAQRATMRLKGKESQDAALFAKFGITSNHPTRFLYIGKDEKRFCVLTVKPLSEEQKSDVSFKVRLNDEIPAFLDHLNNRKIVHPKLTRNWFADDVVITDELRELQDAQKPLLQKKIERYIRNIFLETGERELYYTAEQLRIYSNGTFEREDEVKLDNYLKNVLGLNKYITEADALKGLTSSNKKYSVYRIYDQTTDGSTLTRISEIKVQGRCFTFPAEKFLTAEEMNALFKEDKTKQTIIENEIPY